MRRQVNFKDNYAFCQNSNADQHFHKPEILLFGSVSSVMVDEGTKIRALDISHLISSDYRHIQHTSYNIIIHLRVKDNKTVYCLIRRVLQQLMARAGELGLTITYIVHKVEALVAFAL